MHIISPSSLIIISTTGLSLLPTTIFAQQPILKLNPDILTGSLKNTLDLDLSSNTYSIMSTGCIAGYHPGTSTYIHNIPHPFRDVLPVISSFSNLEYIGIPLSNVRLNGSDNTVGTARFYTSTTFPGANIAETLVSYESSKDRFISVSVFDPFTTSAGNTPDTTAGGAGKDVNITLYSPSSTLTATPTCHGLGTNLNYTTHFCTFNPSDNSPSDPTHHSKALALQVTQSHQLSLASGTNAKLGNRSFSSCPQLQAEGVNGTLGYPGWGGGLFMGVGNSPSGEGAMWSLVLGVILFCSYLIVRWGGVFNY